MRDAARNVQPRFHDAYGDAPAPSRELSAVRQADVELVLSFDANLDRVRALRPQGERQQHSRQRGEHGQYDAEGPDLEGEMGRRDPSRVAQPGDRVTMLSPWRAADTAC